jgi:hypothetical protein
LKARKQTPSYFQTQQSLQDIGATETQCCVAVIAVFPMCLLSHICHRGHGAETPRTACRGERRAKSKHEVEESRKRAREDGPRMSKEFEEEHLLPGCRCHDRTRQAVRSVIRCGGDLVLCRWVGRFDPAVPHAVCTLIMEAICVRSASQQACPGLLCSAERGVSEPDRPARLKDAAR